MISRLLHVLILEDSEDDAFLLIREMRRGGYEVQYERVDKAEALHLALQYQPWDLILSDYTMPNLNALKALTIVKGYDEEIPFIIVSGTINEETAVAAMKAGASDFFSKSRLALLLPAVERELRDAEHRRQRKLAEQEVNFQSRLLNMVGQAIIATDLEGHIIYWNRAAEQLYGWPSDEVRSLKVTDITPHALSQPEAEELMTQLRRGETWQGEFLVQRKDGTSFPALVANAPIHDDNGQLSGIIGISSDISHLKSVETALRESERFARATVDALAANIAILDETGQIIAVNQSWINFARENDSPDEQAYLGANYLDVCHRADTKYFPEASEVAVGIQAIMSGEQIMFTLEYACHSPTEQRWFTLSVTRFHGDGPLRVVVAHKNITERRESTERLRMLYEVSKNLSSAIVDDASQLYTILYEQLAKNLFQAPCFIIAQYHAEEQQATCEFAIIDHEIADPASLPPFKLGVGPISTVIRDWEILIANPADETGQPNRTERIIHSADGRLPQSGIYIPLIAGDKIYGVLIMQHYEANVFDEKDVTLVATIAGQIATVLENAHLYRTIRSHVDNLERRVQERTSELQHARDRVELILSSTSDVIILADQKGNLIQANAAFKQQFQYDPDALFRKSLTALMVKSFASAFTDAVQTAITSRQTTPFEAVCIRQDKTLFEAEMAITPLSYQGKDESSVVCVIHNVTHHKQIETSLRSALEKEKELNELKLRFSSMVSHEFRTPLSVILSSAGLLKAYSDRLPPERKEAKLFDIENQVHRLVSMLDKILALSRAESIAVEMNRKPTDLTVMCQEIVTEIQQTTTSHTIEISVSGENRLLALDPDLMGDVIRNLLTNAVKYSPAGGSVQLRLTYEAEYVTLQVTDSGIGVPEEDLGRLFETFHRAKNVRDISGTGLGLAIVKSAVLAHNGTVSVDSKLGVGTTFTIVLPVMELP